MKICEKCNQTYEDPDANFCKDCEGVRLKPVVADEPKGGISHGYAPDNSVSYQRGDKTEIGGDNISNVHHDNRNVMNTSNTTVHQNIQQTIVEGGSNKFVVCAISGMRVLEVQTAVCPKCNRVVSLQLYEMSEYCCRDCAPSKKKEVRSVAKDIPPLASSGNTTPLATPVVEPIRTAPTGVKPSGGNGNTFRNIALIGAVLLLLGGGAYFLLGSSADDVTTEVVAPETKKAEPAAEVKSTNKATAVVGTSTSAPRTDAKAVAAVTETKTKPAEAMPPSPVDEGKKAYQAGNYSRANSFFKVSAQHGVPEANYYLALMNRQGQGTNKNVKEAFSYMKKAAEGGFAEAYYELSEMYRTGVGVEPNRANARKWCEKASLSNASNADKASTSLNKYYR